MLPHPHPLTPLPPAPGTPCGPPHRHRLAPLLRCAVVMALVLCAVLHGVPAEAAHRSAPPPTAPTTLATSGVDGGHGHHAPEGCAPQALIRPEAQTALSAGDLSLAVPALVVLAALSAAAATSGPLVPREIRRPRAARTGRAALVRTSRWRI